MTDTIANASLFFACVAAHEAAALIRASNDDEDIGRIANAAQCDGIVRVARRMTGAGTWDDDAHQPIFGPAYEAVSDAHRESWPRNAPHRAARELEKLGADLRAAAAIAMEAMPP